MPLTTNKGQGKKAKVFTWEDADKLKAKIISLLKENKLTVTQAKQVLNNASQDLDSVILSNQSRLQC